MDTDGGENSSRKRRLASEIDNEPSEKRRDPQNGSNISNDEITVDNLISNHQQNCPPTGLKTSLHGVSYQLKLILLVLLQMCKLMEKDEDLEFEITTEDPDAGKFDDTVCKYTYNGIQREMCLQAKHKLAEYKIMWSDLTSKASKAAFSLAKYFTSFLEQQNTAVNDQCFVLSTCADLDINVSDLCDAQSPSNTPRLDMIDIFDRIGATCYRFNQDKLKKRGKFEEIKAIFEDCSDCNRLAKMLASQIYDKKKITLQSPLSDKYRNAIAYNIVGTSKGDPKLCVFNVKNHFIAADTQFKRAFEAEYKQYAKTDLDVWKDVSKKGIAFSQNFLPKNDVSTSQLPEDNVTDTTITSFFEKFVLVCSTRSEDQLPAIIMNVWQSTNVHKLPLEQKGVLETEIAYQELSEIIFEWMKSAKSGPLKKDDVTKLFESIVKKFQYLYVRFESNRYIEIVKEFKVQIKSKRLENSKLFGFLCSTAPTSQYDQNIYIFKTSYEAEFSMLIVYQTFLQCFAYASSGEITFMESTKYLQNKDFVRHKLCSTNVRNVLVVVCQEHELITDFYELSSYLKGNNNKVVFIRFYKDCPADESLEDRILVDNLTDSSLKKNTYWNVFGTVALLADIIDDDDDVAVLLKLTGNDSAIKTNLIVQDYDKIKDWYVQRDTKRSVSKKLNQPSEDESANAMVHEQRHALNVSSFKEVDKMSWEEFRPAVEKSFGKSLIDMEQIQTIINSHKQDDVYHPPGVVYDNDVKVHILLEEAGFGKSTYLTWLGWYLQQHDPARWIIRFNAIEYSTDFKRLVDSDVGASMDDTLALRILFQMTHLALSMRNINRLSSEEVDVERMKAEQSAKFLSLVDGNIEVDYLQYDKHSLSPHQLIEMRLFIKKFNSREIILLFDGFDEIIPNYKQVLFDLLPKFEKFDGIDKIYLTSRPYKLKNEFESAFDDVKFYRLKPFSDEDRLVSIDTFLSNEFKEYKRCAPELRTDLLISLECITRYYLWNLRETPLFTRMALDTLATLIQEHIDFAECLISTKIVHLCHDRYEKLQLIESFVENKMKITVEKTQMTDSSRNTVQGEAVIEDSKRAAKEMYSFLALYVIFDTEERKKLLTEGDPKEIFLKYKSFVNRGMEKSGIVEAVQDDIPLFIHRTFAEYFAAFWLYCKRKTPVVNKFLRSSSFWRDNRREMREYFDRMFIKSRDTLHLTAIDKSAGDVKAALGEDYRCIFNRDGAGRTPLHWVTLYYPHNISRFNVLFDQTKYPTQSYLKEKDFLLKWTALDYAFISNDSYAVQQLLEHGAEISSSTLVQQIQQDEAEETLRTVVKYGNLISENSNYRCKKLANAVKTFAKEVTLKVAEYLIMEQQVDLQSPFIKVKENKLSPLEFCVEKKACCLFVNLVEQAGGIETILPDNINGLIKRAISVKNLHVIHYLIVERKCSIPLTVLYTDLFYVIRMTISNHFNTLFKILFKQFCGQQGIKYDEQYGGENEDDREENLCTPTRAILFGQENEFIGKLFFCDEQQNLSRLLYASVCSGNIFATKKIFSVITEFSYLLINLMHFVQLDELTGCVDRRYQDALIAVIEENEKFPRKFENATTIPTLLTHALSSNLFKVARYMIDHKGFYVQPIGDRMKRNAFYYIFDTLNDTRFQKDRQEFFKHMMQKDPYDIFSYKDESDEIVMSLAIEKRHYEIARSFIQNQLSQNSFEEREPWLVEYLKELRLANNREFRDFFSYLLENSIDESWTLLYTRVNERLSHLVEL